jgi:GntR family transcriptional regulator
VGWDRRGLCPMVAAMAIQGSSTGLCASVSRRAEINDDTAINRLSIKHAYQQVADIIAARITADRYPCKLPGERDLAEEFGVAYTTVRHAMKILRERNLVVSIHGRGTFIVSALIG